MITKEAHDLIRAIRKGLGMTQARLAKKARMPQSHLAKIETGKVDLQLGTLRRIFDAMSCDLELVPRVRRGPEAAKADPARESVLRDRAALPVRVLDKEDPRDDLRYWLSKTPEERLDAMEILRNQYFAMTGQKTLPRIAHVFKLREPRS